MVWHIKKKKEDTKIKYIVNKIDAVTEYNSQNIQTNPKLKKEVEKYLAKLVNQFEKQAHEAMTHGLSSTKFESIYAFNGEHVTLHIPM